MTSNVSYNHSIQSDTCSSWSKYSGTLTIKSKEFKLKGIGPSYLPPLEVIEATENLEDNIICSSPLRPPLAEAGTFQDQAELNKKLQNLLKKKALNANETFQKIINNSRKQTEQKNTFGLNRSTISKHLSSNPNTNKQEGNKKGGFNSNILNNPSLSITSSRYEPEDLVIAPTLNSTY